MNPKVLLILSAVVFLFYLTAHLLLPDVYQHAAAGALFELLSLPMLALLAVIPVLCLVHLFQHRGKETRYIVASLFLVGGSILILVLVYG